MQNKQKIEDFILKTEKIDVSALVPLQGELKKLDDIRFNKLRNSLIEKGFRFTLHAWESGNVNYILDGHQRVHVLQQLQKQGYEIPKLTVNFVKAKDFHEAKELILYAVSQYGKIDKDGFEDFIDGLDLDFGKFDLPDFEYDFSELEESKIDPEKDPDDVPEIPEDENPYNVKLGQIWKLGKHRLMCGDSTDINTLKKLCGENEIDLWITDPPYNVDYQGKTKDALKIENDSMDDGSFRLFLKNTYAAADAVMKPGAAFYIWHADSEGYNFRGAAFDIGWKIRQCLIWVKNTFVMGRQDYHWKHEPCLYGWKEGAAHKWKSDRKQTTCIDFDRPNRNDIHPTMKPVGLFEYQIANNTDKNDIVLDSFLGSGTTIIACENLKRTCYGLELDSKYVNQIIRRWEEYTGQTAELIVS